MIKEASKYTLLIVDDDKNTRDGIGRAMRKIYTVKGAQDAETALSILADQSIDVVLTDMRMPRRDGMSLLQEVHTLYPQIPVILLTAYGSIESAVQAMKAGAYDFLAKPINLDHLELIIKRALDQSKDQPLRPMLTTGSKTPQATDLAQLIGTSQAMNHVYNIIRQAAPSQASILIQGPSGTGKELVAHAIHQLSSRAQGPFMAIHCAALSDALLESELFGHEKGAFTGAIATKKGRFELANGGSLFLDEISEINLATQVKLLRVLETRTIERVGSSEIIPVDIRLITATNRNLAELVRKGEFREDLFFRLNVIDINLPPLRERQGDLPLLCEHFIKEFAIKNNKPIDGITPEAMTALQHYPWPGNVRELRNTLEKMIVLSAHSTLDITDIPENISDPFIDIPLSNQRTALPIQPERYRLPLSSTSIHAALPPSPSQHFYQSETIIDHPESGVYTPIVNSLNTATSPVEGLQSVLNPSPEEEAEIIEKALIQAGGNKRKAAELLGISRRTLYRKLDDLQNFLHPKR